MSDNNNNAKNNNNQIVSESEKFTLNGLLVGSDKCSSDEEYVDLVAAKAIEMGACGGEQIPTNITIIGPQSAGKSSLVNHVIALMTGDDEKVAPTSAGVCSMRCLDMHLGEGGSSKYILNANGEIKHLDSATEVFEFLKSNAKGAKVSFKPQDAYKLKIRSNGVGRIMDTPGERIQQITKIGAKRPAEGESTNDQDDYFSCVARIEDSPNPILVVVLRANSDSDPSASNYLASLTRVINQNPAKWQHVEIVVVMTYADAVINNSEMKDLLYKGGIEMMDSFAGMKVKLFLVQTNIAGNESCPLSEVRDAERKTFSSDNFFSTRATFRGQPLYCLGTTELTNYLVSRIKQGVISDEKTLRALVNHSIKRMDEIDQQAKMMNEDNTPYVASREIVRSVTTNVEKAFARDRIAPKIHRGLRELCEAWFQSLKKENKPTKEKDPDIRIEDDTEAAARDIITTNLLEACFDYLADHSETLAEQLFNDFTNRVRVALKSYAANVELYELLYKTFQNFATEAFVEFQKEIRTTIRNQKQMLTVKINHHDKTVFDSWPENSQFLAASKQDVLYEKMVRKLNVLLRYIKNNVIIPYGVIFEGGMDKKFSRALVGQNQSIGNFPKETDDLEREKRTYRLVKFYCETILLRKKAALQNQQPQYGGIFALAYGVVDSVSEFVGIKKQKK